MERFAESFLLDNCTQARSNLQVSARAPRLPGGENLDQAVLGDFEYCCKLFEHRLLDILKAIQYRTDVVFGDAALRSKMESIRNCVATTSPAILAFTARPLTGLLASLRRGPLAGCPRDPHAPHPSRFECLD